MNDIKLHQSANFSSMLPVVTKDEVKEFLLKQHKDAMSDEALDLFINIAATNSLNPYKREIYAVPYWNSKSNKMDIQAITAYTVYLARANMTGLLNGWTTDIEKDKDWNVTGWTITIHRKDRDKPFVWSVAFDEIVQKTKDWKPNTQYRDKPEFMTKKVLISQGMRLCFPEYLSSMPYEESEIQSSNTIDGQIVTPEQPTQPKQRVVKPPKRIEQPATITDVEKAIDVAQEWLDAMTDEVIQEPVEEKNDQAISDLVNDFVSEKKWTETQTTQPQQEMITDAQLKFMLVLCEKTWREIDELKVLMEKTYKVNSRKLLTKAQATSFINELIEIIEFDFTSGVIKLTQEEIYMIWSGDHNGKKRDELVKYIK